MFGTINGCSPWKNISSQTNVLTSPIIMTGGMKPEYYIRKRIKKNLNFWPSSRWLRNDPYHVLTFLPYKLVQKTHLEPVLWRHNDLFCDPRYFSWARFLGSFDFEPISKSISCTGKTKMQSSIAVWHQGGYRWTVEIRETQHEEFWVYLCYQLFLYQYMTTIVKASRSPILLLRKRPEGCQDIRKQG